MEEACVVKQIQLKNFRSLKDTGMQTLAPITLLVGENSSGKSTFLRVFPLLKQSFGKKIVGPILWAGDVNDYVDFGSFEETVTNDGSKDITIGFGLDVPTRLLPIISGNKTTQYNCVDIELQLTITSLKGQERASLLRLKINETHCEFDLDAGKVLVDGKEVYIGEMGSADKENSETYRPNHYRQPTSIFRFSLPSLGDVTQAIAAYCYTRSQSRHARSSWYIDDAVELIGEQLILGAPITAFEETQSRLKPLADAYNRTLKYLNSSEGLDMMPRIKLHYIYRLFEQINEYIERYFKNVHYIAPLRATAERYYRLRNWAVDEVDYQGKNLAIFVNNLEDFRLREFQEWTGEYFGFSVDTRTEGGHLSLLIKQTNSGREVNLCDTGFGYSQILPIITQLWDISSRRGVIMNGRRVSNVGGPVVIAIEQPELHLHPGIQAKLAKAFIASIELAKKNEIQLQILLETHSKTIVNYMGHAIEQKMIRQEDISVILFERREDNGLTDVKNSGYDEDGYLVNWPYGFFEPEV